MSNLGLERYLASEGLAMIRTPVGDRYVSEYMRAHGFNVGGEQSGHIILSDYSTTGDGLVAALQVLAVVCQEQKPVSEVCHRFDPVPQIKKNIRFKGGEPLQDDKVKQVISAAETRLGDRGRLVIRQSGTEPVIRVMGEGDNADLVSKVVDEIIDALQAAA
jgi:phosphoglucosamine mutase